MNRGTIGVNSLPKTVTRQRRGCDLNPGPSAPESSTLTTRLPSSSLVEFFVLKLSVRPRAFELIIRYYRTMRVCVCCVVGDARTAGGIVDSGRYFPPWYVYLTARIAARCRLFLRMSTEWANKAEPETHDHNSVKSYRWKKFTVRFLGKFVVKWILQIPPHLAYVATLPRETLMSAKQAISDKFHSVATYLRCGGVVNNQIMKGLLLSLSANFF